jgi:phage shock protein PspC (stress-responsive transcriptional regulator)
MFPHKDVTAIRFIFGFATHFFAGATVGILLFFVLKITGKDYALLKSI